MSLQSAVPDHRLAASRLTPGKSTSPVLLRLMAVLQPDLAKPPLHCDCERALHACTAGPQQVKQVNRSRTLLTTAMTGSKHGLIHAT